MFSIPLRYIIILSNPSPNPACLQPPYLLKSKCYISDEAGNIITGGELWESNGGGANIVTHEMMENHVYELSGTQPGVRYRIVANNAGVSVSFKDLVLIYE